MCKLVNYLLMYNIDNEGKFNEIYIYHTYAFVQKIIISNFNILSFI